MATIDSDRIVTVLLPEDEYPHEADDAENYNESNVDYEGRVCLLDDPSEIADPRTAFRENPMVEATVQLDYRGVSPMYGGKPQHADGRELEDAGGFAKAHYEQHCSVTGTITVGDEAMDIDGLACGTSHGGRGSGKPSAGTDGCPWSSPMTSP